MVCERSQETVWIYSVESSYRWVRDKLSGNYQACPWFYRSSHRLWEMLSKNGLSERIISFIWKHSKQLKEKNKSWLKMDLIEKNIVQLLPNTKLLKSNSIFKIVRDYVKNCFKAFYFEFLLSRCYDKKLCSPSK